MNNKLKIGAQYFAALCILVGMTTPIRCVIGQLATVGGAEVGSALALVIFGGFVMVATEAKDLF